MGCSVSKHQVGRDERNAPFARGMPLPTCNGNVEGRSLTKSACKSGKPGSKGNDLIGVDVAMNHVGSSQTAHMRSASKIKPTKEEDSTVLSSKQIGVEGLDNSPCMLDSKSETRKPDWLVSFGCSAETKVSFSGKWTPAYDSGSRKVRCGNYTYTPADGQTSSCRVTTESLGGNLGLRLLLSPVLTPSRNFMLSTRSGTLSKTLSSSGRLVVNHHNDRPRILDTQTVPNCKSVPLEIAEGMGDSEVPGSPLFDPSILATFERVVETLSDDNWQSSDGISSRSSRVACLLDTCSDADSLDWRKDNGFDQGDDGFFGTHGRIASDIPRHTPVSKKKPFSSKVAPLCNDGWTKRDCFEVFELKCPPGCEDKIVLYSTSLRGIRKTYEDCCAVRLILKGFQLQVDERDVWMHCKFRQELTNVVGALSVPRLFVKGRYIGGVDDVKYLHEEGILGNLLEGLPAEMNNMCDVCGGVRFILCTSCSGSCKLIFYREVSRCPDCNENGLMMCPSCYW